MSTKAKQNIYEVRFYGEYYTHTKGKTALYEFFVKMDEKAKDLGFLHVFRRQILKNPLFERNVIRKKYPDWKRHRTTEEDGAILIKEDGTRKPVMELALMNYRQLAKYITEKKLGIETTLYPTAAELKQAIRDYRDNRNAFIATQDKKKERLGPVLEVVETINQLNDWEHMTDTDPKSRPEEWDEDKPLADDVAPKDLEEEDELQRLLEAV